MAARPEDLGGADARSASARWTARMTLLADVPARQQQCGDDQERDRPGAHRRDKQQRGEQRGPGRERLIEGARVPLRGVLVSQAIGQTLHRARRRRRLRADGQRQSRGHERDRGRRRALRLGPPRDRRGLHGRRLRARQRAARRRLRAPGAGADERDHRADRGGEVAHAADPARRRHAGRAAALELPDRPGRARGVRRRGGRARATGRRPRSRT